MNPIVFKKLPVFSAYAAKNVFKMLIVIMRLVRN
jgi:hypothetical protein